MAIERGYTLIEAVLVLLIVGILAAFIAPILGSAVDSYDDTAQNVEALTKLRYAMERLAREIRAIRRDPLDPGSYDIVSPTGTYMTATRFDFCRSDGRRITIDNASVATEVRLADSTPASYTSTCPSAAVTALTLADKVTTFSLTYRTASGAAATGKTDVAFVDIALTLTSTGGVAHSAAMRVDLRNP